MANKKKKSISPIYYSPESIGEVKKQLRTFNWYRVLLLVLSTIAAFTVFEAILGLEEQRGFSFSIITPVYYVIVTILAIAVVLLNHGLSKKPFTPDMLREDVPPDEASMICAKLNRQKAWAKKLMMLLVPFMLALLLDIVYLFYGDLFSNLVELLSPNS
jgi:hypothetical protein